MKITVEFNSIEEMLDFQKNGMVFEPAPKLYVDIPDPTETSAQEKTEEAPTPAPEEVPFAEEKPAISFDSLQAAAVALVNQGKSSDLRAILESFNVNALPALQPVSYAEFAEKLKELGAEL